MIRSPKRRSQSRSPDLDAASDAPAADSQASQGQEFASASAADSLDDGKTGEAVYEIIKRGRGRPRKDGLPNKSTVAVKRRVPTAREKRDAAQARKRERQLEKAGRARTQVKAEEAGTKNRPSPAEVCGFRELKI